MPDRDPAMAHEPLRHVGHQRPERRRGADANEQVHQRERQQARNQRRTDIADAERQGAQHDRDHDAEAVAQPSHCDTAQGKARHRKRIGQGGVGPGDAEISLHERQSNRYRPHADAADGADRDRKSKPPPCRRRVDLAEVGDRANPGNCPATSSRRGPLMPRLYRQPSAAHGYRSPIVTPVNEFTGVQTVKRLAVFCGAK